MRRLLIALAGGVSVPILFIFVGFIVSITGLQNLESLGWVYFVVVGWPLTIFNKMFPPPIQCPDCGPIGKAVVATMLFDVIFYSSLIYFFLWWRKKVKHLK